MSSEMERGGVGFGGGGRLMLPITGMNPCLVKHGSFPFPQC